MSITKKTVNVYKNRNVVVGLTCLE